MLHRTASALSFAAALLALAASLPAGAASSASSAASESVGLSSNGVSASLRTSSNSSTKTDVAQGEYRVVEVLALATPEMPDAVALRLQRADASGPATDDNAFLLVLPPPAHAASGVAAGTLVRVTQREFGLEFARSDTRQAFFLVLQDRAVQDLQTRKVS